MVWCGVVWCGVVWCGVVWCGVVWCGVVWCGVVWCGVVWCGVVWCDVVWCGVVWCGVVWCGVVWCDVVWCGVVWCGVVWCSVVWRGATHTSTLLHQTPLSTHFNQPPSTSINPHPSRQVVDQADGGERHADPLSRLRHRLPHQPHLHLLPLRQVHPLPHHGADGEWVFLGGGGGRNAGVDGVFGVAKCDFFAWKVSKSFLKPLQLVPKTSPTIRKLLKTLKPSQNLPRTIFKPPKTPPKNQFQL